jgi:hypothetical protein
MSHDGSVHNSERRAIEAAEARGHDLGISDGIELAAAFLERIGDVGPAAKLRNARIVDREVGNVVDLTKGAERG